MKASAPITPPVLESVSARLIALEAALKFFGCSRNDGPFIVGAEGESNIVGDVGHLLIPDCEEVRVFFFCSNVNLNDQHQERDHWMLAC